MSGSLESPVAATATEELRRRFALWTLAMVGTFSGSGAVQLRSQLWAAEEPPAGLPQDAQPSSAKDETSSSAAAETLTRQSLEQLISRQEFDQAQELVQKTLRGQPTEEHYYLAVSFASALSRTKPDEAQVLYQQMLDDVGQQLKVDSPSQLISSFVLAAQGASRLLDESGHTDRAIATLQAAIERLSNTAQRTPMRNALPVTLAQLFVEHDRASDARTLLMERYDQAHAEVTQSATPKGRQQLATSVSNFARILGDDLPDEATRLITQVQPQLLRAVQSEEATVEDYRAYQSIQLALANLCTDRDPEQALQIIQQLKPLAESLTERLDEADAKQLRGSQASLDSALSRIQSRQVQQKLIGQPAPEFQIEAVVNRQRVDWAQLKGKVVLIDFWAVWCGPCIATFPHLRHLHETYAAQGLEIIGVTRQYGYVWDEEAGTQVSDKEATLEQELVMLEQFRLKHQLPYGFIVTPKESDYNKLFGVYGIPQAVVVDRNGHVQLVVTGSGNKSASQVEEKIKSLIEAREP